MINEFHTTIHLLVLYRPFGDLKATMTPTTGHNYIKRMLKSVFFKEPVQLTE